MSLPAHSFGPWKENVMRKQFRLSLVILASILLYAAGTSPAMALCFIECSSGDSCTGRPLCCCVDDTWAYCGPIAGNPCSVSPAHANRDVSLQASYQAIFSAASPRNSEASRIEPGVKSVSR
jgi:hypothetical protein